MTESEMLALARREGFEAGIVETGEIEFDPRFRTFCAENLCGKYGANYSCPPDCGTPEEMRARIARYPRALVFRSEWPIADYQDQEAIRLAKREHNGGMLRAIDQMRAAGIEGTMAGASNCTLCARCKILDNAPCPVPERRFSCLSAVLRVRAQACRARRHGVRRGRRHRLRRAVCLRARRGFRTRLRPPAAPRSLPRAFALSTDALRKLRQRRAFLWGNARRRGSLCAQRRCAPPPSKAAARIAESRPTRRFGSALSADARRPFPRPPRACRKRAQRRRPTLAGNVSAADRRRSPRAFTPIAATVWSRSPRIRANRGTASTPSPPPRIHADRSTASAPSPPRTFTPIASNGWRRPPAHSRQLRHRFGAVPPAHSHQSFPSLWRRPPAHSRQLQHRFGAVPPHIHATCSTASAPFPRRSRANRFRRLAPFSHAFAPIAATVGSTYANPPPSLRRGRVCAPWAGRMPRDGRRPALCRGGSGSPRHNRSGAFKTVDGCAQSAAPPFARLVNARSAISPAAPRGHASPYSSRYSA